MRDRITLWCQCKKSWWQVVTFKIFLTFSYFNNILFPYCLLSHEQYFFSLTGEILSTNTFIFRMNIWDHYPGSIYHITTITDWWCGPKVTKMILFSTFHTSMFFFQFKSIFHNTFMLEATHKKCNCGEYSGGYCYQQGSLVVMDLIQFVLMNILYNILGEIFSLCTTPIFIEWLGQNPWHSTLLIQYWYSKTLKTH